jgi:acetate kinase
MTPVKVHCEQLRRISTGGSPVAVLVVPTNAELAIAQDCVTVV